MSNTNKSRRIFSLFVLLSLVCMCQITQAQTYIIQSLDGYSTRVSFLYKPFSKKMTVSCAQDTVYLDDCTGGIHIILLNNIFLQVTYQTRSGTDSEVKQTAIIAVKKSKIKVSMLISSYADWSSISLNDPHKIDRQNGYSIKFKLNGTNINNYIIIANINEYQISKDEPQGNYKRNKLVSLKFDPTNAVFYSATINPNREFLIRNHNNRRRVFIKQPIFSIILSNNYYYINNYWYEKGYDNNLFSNYYK